MKRRTFIQLTSLAAAGVVSGCAKPAASKPFGIQLYTLRDVIAENPKAVLKQLADFGYGQIESYEGPMGMFWGMSNTEFKSYLDSIGLELVASHINMNEDLERKAEEAAAIGVKHLICPWIGPQPSLDDYKAFAVRFNEAGEACRKAGIRFAYHNHAYTFEPMDGIHPQDILVSETDAELVDFELDLYWVAYAGQDPAVWIRKHGSRYTHSHIKDLGTAADGGRESVTLGTGTLDFAAILAVGAEHGMHTFIVEQEQYTGTTPIEAARENAVFMRGILKFK
jgi:sugar phosphate isomerase/epimerase